MRSENTLICLHLQRYTATSWRLYFLMSRKDIAENIRRNGLYTTYVLMTFFSKHVLKKSARFYCDITRVKKFHSQTLCQAIYYAKSLACPIKIYGIFLLVIIIINITLSITLQCNAMHYIVNNAPRH